MLIDFNYIVQKYGAPAGVLHVGAHMMEERELYKANNINDIVWVEANPEIFNKIKSVASDKEYIFNYAICDVDDTDITLNITNNGQSSSVLELGLHMYYHPDVYVSNKIQVKSKQIDTLFKEQNLNAYKYDFLNLDIQGAELLALKGCNNILPHLKYIYTEINTNKIYQDCCLVEEIDEFLTPFSFKRVETSMTPCEWGDALYIKQ